MKINWILILLFFFFLAANAKSQVNIDSLWKVYQNEKISKEDRLQAMDDFIWDGYMYSNPDSAYYFTQMMYESAKKWKSLKYQGRALNTQGVTFYLRGKSKDAINCYFRSIKIKKKIGDKKGIASSYTNLGNIYHVEGDNVKSIEYYTKSLKLSEELGYKNSVADSYICLGIVNQKQKEYKKAREYFANAKDIYTELGQKHGISLALVNIGIIYYSQNLYYDAISYFEKTLEIQREIGDLTGEANIHLHLGNTYLKQENLAKARKEFEISITLAEQTGDLPVLASALTSIAIICNEQNDKSTALKNATRALELSNESNIAEIKQASYEVLYTIYKNIGQYEKSLDMYEQYLKLRDSLNNSEAQKELVRQEFKYKYEKKATADSVKTAQEKKITKAKLDQEQTQRYALYGGLGLTLIFGIFMFNRFRITRKQKNIIEEQKDIVEQQKHLVEEKQREVMDSIHYAKRIQEALMPSTKNVNKNLERLKKQ